MTTPSENLLGLSYKKLDLHVHTPASKCFEGNCTPEQIVDTAIERELAGIAITDHNSAEWVDKVIEAAKGSPLAVFPGVEVSSTGGKKCIHILALFDTSKGAKDVQVLLNRLGITGGYGEEETLTNKSPVEVIDEICKLGGIAVLAHANSDNGVLSDMSGIPRTRVVQHASLLAVEATDFGSESKRAKHRRVVDLLDGSDVTYRRKLAVYQASDNPDPDGSGRHCLEGIGARCAYFKLEQVNLEGIRQCFVDPDPRIRQDFEVTSFDYPRIGSVSIKSGFLDGQTITFHPGLTSILGAKGAGKSLLVEFMRFALNQEPGFPSIAQDHAAKLSERLGAYGAVEVTFVDETGKELRISRTYRELDDSPYAASVPYDPAQICPVLFLSQNEIIRIAEDEKQQLAFIDRFFDFRTHRANIAALERKLKPLDELMATGLRAYSEVEALDSELATLNMEIARLDGALAHPVFEKFRQLQSKEHTLSDQLSHLSTMIARIEDTRKTVQASLAPDVPEALARDPALQRNRDLIAQVHELLEEQLSHLIEELRRRRAEAQREHNEWRAAYDDGRREYEEYVQKMGSDYQGLAVRRDRALRQQRDVEQSREAAQRKKDGLRDISRQRGELLEGLEKAYEEYTRARQQKCAQFQKDSLGRLRLQILGSSNVDQFRNTLLALKRGSYLREEEIDAICSEVKSRDFVLSLLRYDATRESSHLEERAKEADISLRRMKTLADFLLSEIPYENLLALQYEAHPQDRPEIHYNVGDGEYQPLTKVSVGQKCTALLIMALSDGTMPIVIDQPEDSLDVRSIWDDVCLKVRGGKERRQFIFTTHNSSLAVASDTDCFLILEGSASRGQVVHLGSMDHQPVSGEVLKYLEGGPTTYELKYAKYGGNQNRPGGEGTAQR